MATPEPAGLSVRLIAAERLTRVLAGSRFAPFVAAELADGRDRALANRLVTTALRRHGQLDVIIGRLLDRGMPAKSGSFEAQLRIGLAQLLYLPEIGAHSAIFLAVEAAKRDRRAQHLSKLLNALLRRAQKETEALRGLSDDLLFPPELRQRWLAAYGAVTVERFAAALLEGGSLDLTLRTDDAAALEELGGRRLLPDVVRLDSRDRSVEALPGFAAGDWWVQDVAASLPARLIDLPAGARVLDLCAAPGGKTAQLVKAGYRVTAVDNDRERVGRLEANLGRLGYAADVVVADAASFGDAASYDAILLDAPCSATGTFRRHPEVTWHRRSGELGGRIALQRQLLANAARLLRPGGQLVYCVCSLEIEEGEQQADWIAANLPELEAVPIQPERLGPLVFAVDGAGRLRTLPGTPLDGGGTLDGFFSALYTRRSVSG